jgi:ketosteroid isomerase-like protein
MTRKPANTPGPRTVAEGCARRDVLAASAALLGAHAVDAQAVALAGANSNADVAALALQVGAAERAFARSMAERDHAAFTSWLAAQAVFFGNAGVLRGQAAVAAGWKAYFEGPTAPFSWAPDQVQVLDDGTLALSTGPVLDAAGKPIARFNSIWRQEAPGVWRIVFDKGQPPDPAAR